MGHIVDGLKFAGGSYSLMPKSLVKEVIDVAHQHDVYVSTGDWAENLLRKGPSAFKEYVEVSFGRISVSDMYIWLLLGDLT